MHGMGVVLRCPACDTPVLRIVRTPGFLRLDLSGILLLTIPESVSLVTLLTQGPRPIPSCNGVASRLW